MPEYMHGAFITDFRDAARKAAVMQLEVIQKAIRKATDRIKGNYSQDFDAFHRNATEFLGARELQTDVDNFERWARLEVTNLTTQLATLPNMAYLYTYLQLPQPTTEKRG